MKKLNTFKVDRILTDVAKKHWSYSDNMIYFIDGFDLDFSDIFVVKKHIYQNSKDFEIGNGMSGLHNFACSENGYKILKSKFKEIK